MKIYLMLIILFVIGLAVLMRPAAEIPEALSPRAYRNEQFGYEISIPENYVINDRVPELVEAEKSGIRLRVNAGCYDFGAEDLTRTESLIILNGEPAVQEEYFYRSQLKMRRISLNHEGKCYAVEIMAESEGDWAEATLIAKTIRFVR